MMRALPWIVAVVASLLAAWSWVLNPGRTTQALPPAVAAEEAVQPAQAEHPLRVTLACLNRLELAQAALTRCRGAAGGAREPGADAECLTPPQVGVVVEKGISDAMREHSEHEGNRQIEARERTQSAFEAWSEEALSLTADEGEWLTDYVCAARELRERTLASLDETPSADALAQLKEQRALILADVEKTLGPDRYTTLRAIGGIGLLADATDCS